jgi:hypothetical protein
MHEQRAQDAEHDTAVARMPHESVWPARHKSVVRTQRELKRKEGAKRLVARETQCAARGRHQTPEHESWG